MIPAAFVILASLPVTPSGKLDRAALPEPNLAAEISLAAPRGLAEELLASLWAHLLGREKVGAQDNFFELGGHSLLATRLISRVRAVFQVEIPLRSLFDAPTVAGLAAVIEEERGGAGLLAPPIVPVGRDRELPLSFAQQRLWFIDQLRPGESNYNLAMPLRIAGPLDAALLGRTLSDVVRRHEVLRTRFQDVDGRGVQVIRPPSPVDIPRVDLGALPRAAVEAEALRVAKEAAERPFDLGGGDLLRLTLLRLNGEGSDHAALFVLHHIISDGWSTGVLVREVMAIYEAFAAGRPSPLPELAIQFADFAVWQREWLTGEVLERQLAYWKARLTGAPAFLDLPTDRPRPALQSTAGASRRVHFAASLVGPVTALSRREGVTPFMTLLAVFQALLSRYSGQSEVVVGTPIAGRDRLELEPLIGFFVNTLPIRTGIGGGAGFRRLLAEVRTATLDAYVHQDLPFEKLIDELGLERHLSHTPLFQTMFALQTLPSEALILPGLTVSSMAVGGRTAKFDLTLDLEERNGEVRGRLEYSTELWDEETMDRLLLHLGSLLEGVVAEPEARVLELALLTPVERHQLLAEWNDTVAPFPEATLLHQFFEEAAERAPQALAAVCLGKELSYVELEARSNRLAQLLRRRGIGRGAPVGVWVERSLDLLTAVFGVLKAGGHYVALEEGWPAERVESILGATGAPALIAGPTLLGAVEEMRWRLPALADVVCLAIAEQEAPAEAIDEAGVRELWDLVAERGSDRVTAGGFTSAFTGEAMSEAEVDEYRDRVLSLAAPWLRPGARVLEIGNGSGLLLWEMAARGARVTGFDPSPLTQERNREQAAREGIANIELRTGFAHEVEAGLGTGERFDLILLASTVQFFPGPRYLARVVRQALGRLAPGGALLIADVLDARRREELRRAIAERRGGVRSVAGAASCTSTRGSSRISGEPSITARKALPTSWVSVMTCCSLPKPPRRRRAGSGAAC